MLTEQELDRLLDTWDAPAPSPTLRRGLVDAVRPRRTKWRWLALAAVAIPVAVANSVYEPSGRVGGVSEGASDGVYVRVTQFASPPASAFHWWFKGGRFSIGSGPEGDVHGRSTVHDRKSGQTWGFGYRIHRSSGQFGVGVSELAGAHPLPGSPSTATVADGGARDVEVSRSGNEHLYLRLEVASSPFAGMFQERPLGGAQLRLAQPRLTVSGADAGADRSTAPGATVWVWFSGHTGCNLIAQDPKGNPNFTPNGAVRGTTLEFQLGAERIRIDCARPIATHDAMVYVWHDKTFDRVETLSGSAGPACYFNGACFRVQ